MSGLLHIRRVRVPIEKAEEAHSYLRKIGFQGAEAVALWAGVATDTTFEVRETIIPRQKPHRTPTGMYYTVSSEELHRINVWLDDNGMQLIAQLHSHPREAYHSELDDELPIATTIGCFSLVIPDFARDPFSLRHCAVYRLVPERGWAHLKPLEVSRLITITSLEEDAVSGSSPVAPLTPSDSPTEAEPTNRAGRSGTSGKTLWDWLLSLKRQR